MHPHTLIQQAINLFQNGKLSDSEAVLSRLLLIQPKNFDALHILGVIKGLKGQHAEAKRLFLKAIQINPANNFVHFNLAKALAANNEDTAAIPHHIQATQLAPQHKEAWLNYGESLSKLRKYTEALECFNRCLAIDPTYAAAHSNQGVTQMKLKQHENAIESFQRALEIDATFADAWCNLGVPLHALERYEDALAAYERALALQPDLAKAWSNKVATLHKLGRDEDALAAIERALALQPMYAEAWFNKGNLLGQLKRHADALAAYEHALELQPDHAEAWCNKGAALNALKRYDQALAACDRALQLRADVAEAWTNASGSFFEQKRYAEALNACDHAINLQPDNAEIWSTKGAILSKLKRFDEALAACDRAIQLRPELGQAWANKGNIFNELWRHDEALAAYAQAIQLQPSSGEIWLNKGNTLGELKRYDEAVACYDHGIDIDPELLPSGRFNKSLIELIRGDFDRGWINYECRWEKKAADTRRHTEIPKLEDLLNIAGKRILVWFEQGFGDTIQFARYVQALLDLGAKVVFEVQPALKGLMARQFDCTVISAGDHYEAVDFQTPLLTLPLLFKTNLDTIPRKIFYIRAAEEKVLEWSRKLDLSSSQLNIGIACSGNANFLNDKVRPIRLEELSPLLNFAKLFLIQKEVRDSDRHFLSQHQEIRFLGTEIKDFDDSAAIVENMDLVISIDTSLAHLAGALGKPVLVLLAWASDWRWLLDREDSPWYPSAKLFRQAEIRDWKTVVESVVHEIRAHDLRTT